MGCPWHCGSRDYLGVGNACAIITLSPPRSFFWVAKIVLSDDADISPAWKNIRRAQRTIMRRKGDQGGHSPRKRRPLEHDNDGTRVVPGAERNKASVPALSGGEGPGRAFLRAVRPRARGVLRHRRAYRRASTPPRPATRRDAESDAANQASTWRSR